jgi:hypothetical protein
MTLIAPVVHVNGSSSVELRRQYTEAYQALTLAQNALSAIEAHNRDYYCHRFDNAGELAREQKRVWIQSLESVKKQLMAINMAIINKKGVAEV